MPDRLPSLSSRLADVDSCVVRDILELTQQEEVISFAGGLPAPELFPAAPLRTALGVAFAPGAPFFATRPDHRTLRLSFITHVPDEIVEGLARLRSAARDSR